MAPSPAISREKEIPSSNRRPGVPRLVELALLKPFGETDRQALEAAGATIPLHQGQRVIEEGKRHDAVWIILAGRLAVTREGQKVAELGVGQLCGEMEMLNPPHSTASVTAAVESVVWRITRDQLRDFLGRHAEAGQAFMKLLAGTFAARLADS